MNIPVISAITDVFGKLFGVVDQLVEDKDKKNEIVLKIAELQNQLALQLIQTSTVPWVDATVKILFAVRDIILPMFRPVVAAAMAAYVVYAEINGITMSPMVEAMFAGAFPAWGASRWSEKKAGKSK